MLGPWLNQANQVALVGVNCSQLISLTNQTAVPPPAPPVVQVRLVPPALAHLRRRREPLRGAAQEQDHHGEEQEHGGHRAAAGGRVSATFYTREKLTSPSILHRHSFIWVL